MSIYESQPLADFSRRSELLVFLASKYAKGKKLLVLEGPHPPLPHRWDTLSEFSCQLSLNHEWAKKIQAQTEIMIKRLKGIRGIGDVNVSGLTVEASIHRADLTQLAGALWDMRAQPEEYCVQSISVNEYTIFEADVAD